MNKFVVLMTIIAVIAAIFFAGWVLIYPSQNDPKNIRYVLWRVGVLRMNPDIVTGTMIGDANASQLIVGKTEEDLRKKFGHLSEPSEVAPYLLDCYQRSFWKDRRVLFIRTSPWMVVFDGNRATNLVLIKGC